MAKKKNEVVENVNMVEEPKVVEEPKKTLTSIKDFDELLAKHRSTLDGLVSEYNNLDDDSTAKAAFIELQEKIDKAVKSYNDVSFAKLLHKIRKASNPMETAVKEFSYPVIKAQIKSDGDGDLITEQMVVVPAKKTINLKTIDTKLNHKFGTNSGWINIASDLSRLFAIRAKHELRIGDENEEEFYAEYENTAKVVNARFDITEEAMNILKMPDILSNSKAKAALQQLIDAMFGADKYTCISVDVKFILFNYVKLSKGEPGKVKSVTMNQFLEIVLHVCHKLVTHGKYDVDFPVAKH